MPFPQFPSLRAGSPLGHTRECFASEANGGEESGEANGGEESGAEAPR